MTDEQPNELPDIDEKRLGALLRTMEDKSMAPDMATLDALREQSETAFAEEDAGSPSRFRLPDGTSHSSRPRPADGAYNAGRRKFTLRAAVALAAATAAGLAIWFSLWRPGSSSAAIPFSDVLSQLRGADSLKLQVTKAGKTAEVWFRAPGLVRWEETPQRYRIAAGSRLWKIDEATNTVATGDSPWFIDKDRQVDLLGLLDVGVKESSPLLAARPVDRTEYDGRDCLVYRVDLPSNEGRIEVEAFADAKSKQLVGITAQPAGIPRNGPPLAELRLVAFNPPVDESKFVVAKSLTDDGRIGKVTDAQGVVTVRPVLARRWTPVCRETQLRPGDWLRTDIRGANAVKARLSSEVELTLGPGTLIECISPGQARLHTGELQVNLPKQEHAQFELLAPRDGSQKFTAAGKSVVRVDAAEKLVAVKQTPKWLAGFEGTSSDESLGSLVVNMPDGRNEPLAVGYHKVSVEIRDQIARTTIEESFVNHTPSRLEGVFHFPLPQDASISGFGMWIGNDLIEADVVEKQRAREIYETILRERRDPGLLEWAGGNIFKARVFPIEPNSEKRIKIVYTQVLPLRANRYRYSYGLRSELLRTKPLRELSLAVTVNSALPLKSVACPTHSARIEHTDHSAKVEFSAQEYAPSRDFEVVCEIDGRQSDVVVVPHRRGADGYFLLQLTPPSPEGNWQRELLPDGKPLQLILLCDTSASMDAEKRKQQAAFVAAVLSSLGENDRFWLAAADVGTVWASKEPLVPTAANIAKTRDFLDGRLSLGWTDLAQGFEAVLKKAPPGAQVIYVGDGIVTAGESDPASFVKQLRRLVERAKPVGEKLDPVFHAVTVGNSFESTVLKGIAAINGGSVRNITGDQTPQSVALELLNEIAQPGLRDMKIEFRGLQVAAIYPDRLPNIAAGTQQILVGRYLPTGKDQKGEVIITGRRGSEPVRYAAHVDLADAEQGNSFLPRLWARAHLDHLLAQGESTSIRDEIIALSEEFHIITPYTSLLVLETDADRERFGVKRRFEMRDGERFFAAGHDNANFELMQQQMKRAGDWRIGLRQQVLANLAQLGRNSREFDQAANGFAFSQYFGAAWGGAELNKSVGFEADDGRHRIITSSTASAGGLIRAGLSQDYERSVVDEFNGPLRGLSESGETGESAFSDLPFEVDDLSRGDDVLINGVIDFNAPFPSSGKSKSFVIRAPLTLAFDQLGWETNGASSFGGYAEPSLPAATALAISPYLNRAAGGRMGGGGFGGFLSYSQPDLSPNYTAWIDAVFPQLAGPPSKQLPQKPSETWTADAIALAKSLLRTDALRKLDGGIEIRRVTETFDPRWKRQTSRNGDLGLYSPSAWLTRSLNAESDTIVDYCDAKERGVFSLGLLLGRTRKSIDRDLQSPPLPLVDLSLSPLDESHRGQLARVEKGDGPNRAVLIIKPKNSEHEERYHIDTAKHVLLKVETFDAGKLTSMFTYSDFVEVAGMWWAEREVNTDGEGQMTAETKMEVSKLAPDAYRQQLAAELAGRPTVQFMHLPLPRLKVARQRIADGSTDFDDRIAIILHYTSLQQWDDLLEQLVAAEKSATGRPGMRWLRTVLLATMRRNDEARERLLAEARKLAEKQQPRDFYLAEFILSQARGVTSPAEFLDFVNLLKPVYDRQPVAQPGDIVDSNAAENAKLHWQDLLLGALDGVGRNDEALALRRTLAEKMPWDLNRQTDYARRLMQAGQGPAAYKWLDAQLDRPVKRPDSEDDSLRSAYVDLYRGESRWADLLRYTTAWIARKPKYDSAYSQHLSAMIYNDKYDAAVDLAQTWLRESQIAGELAPDQECRLNAALNFAQGNINGIWPNRMDERWYEPIADAARFFINHPRHLDIVQRLMDSRFTDSDACDRLRGEFLTLLEIKLSTLTPDQISALVGWTLNGRMTLAEPLAGRRQLNANEIPDEVWRKIAAEMRERWTHATDKDGKNEKHLLGQTLQTIYQTRFNETELLPFLRQRIDGATAEFKQGYIMALFEALRGRKWTEAVENEAFKLLRDLSDADEAADRLGVEIPALYRLVDSMIANRQAAAERELEDKGQTDRLTRTELAKKKADIRRAARAGVAARLAAEIGRAKPNDPLIPWFSMEQAYLDVGLDQNLGQIEQHCWKILGDAPPKFDPDAEPDENETAAQMRQKLFDAVLRQRAFVTAMNLAARRAARPATIDRVLKYIDAGMAQAGDAAAPWRTTKYQMLIALDRPDDLERQLREWIRADSNAAPWRKMLALLLAERGKLDEAIGLFEAAEKDHLLTAADYRTLADWYLVRGRRDAAERSRIEVFKQMPEYQLGNLFYSVRRLWYPSERPLPTELDENSLLAFHALFEKSAQPENYLWQLRDLYAACRDFRLLEVLPDAVLGRSPQQIYTFLQSLQGQVLGELHSEAPADEILARIKSLRAEKRTATDLRALDLFEALIERRSAEVLNQPGPHVAASVAALRRAFDRAWSDGEPILMAGFLQSLGTLPQPPLIDEQLRELRALQAIPPAASRDRLKITNSLSSLLFWSYNKHDQALQEMEAEMRGYEQAHGGQWPYEDDDLLDSYVKMLEGAGRDAAGETLLQRYLAKPQNDPQRYWLEDRILGVYNHAIETGGEVSLGSGDTLLSNVTAAERKQLEASPDESVRFNLVNRMAGTFDAANKRKLSHTADELRRFAFETMPAVLRRQEAKYRETAQAPLGVIDAVLGPKFALQYIVERLEQFPAWLDLSWNSGWNMFGYEMARRREEAANAKLNIADLEPRVLKLAIRELKRELRTGENRNGSIYRINNQYYWAAKTPDFAAAAEEVYREHKSSGRRVPYIAQYLWNGLNLRSRAIEMLLMANKDGVLDEGQQMQLVQYLHEENRFAESIPILEPLVVTRPDNMQYRTRLMTAYFHTKRPEQLRDLVQQTARHFHEGGRWTEGNIAEFARGCLGCDLAERAAGYFHEAIALHQRANPASGTGDGALSDLYQQLAAAHSKLGQTREAVEAAMGAIVCWSPNQQQRTDAINRLKQVLADSKDLDAYVHQLDEQSAKSGQDNPIVRKAIGQTYQARNQHAKAIAQLQLAAQLQPNDAEIYQALIACYDAMKNRPEATRQLLRLIDLKPHDLPLYLQLAERMKGDEAEAERAATSIVEAGPREPENHAALADMREKQNRWSEAAAEWEQVVKLQRLEPTGLIKLAEAQLHLKRWDAAQQSIDRLQKTEWPSRFFNVGNEANRLQQQLPKKNH